MCLTPTRWSISGCWIAVTNTSTFETLLCSPDFHYSNLDSFHHFPAELPASRLTLANHPAHWSKVSAPKTHLSVSTHPWCKPSGQNLHSWASSARPPCPPGPLIPQLPQSSLSSVLQTQHVYLLCPCGPLSWNALPSASSHQPILISPSLIPSTQRVLGQYFLDWIKDG